ncbi:2-dehydro-3-deoxyphosphooctonate aldolase [Flavobacterium silvaticum]|uniref:2-dehydro-3-deoxyphosphooctonate aldolase n=1 Tax=Flavobacterium silvaticum TaxID=1852020 RepID=A0A972JEJ3_9FLAO|nr:2-dehydro-3-deoxyphosphooctonate aldolase [Flavobacterium silvaticum]NMH26954.1 2-dehydro-3-deoxyphosphooctonate aldolase [Flavobacterium silvaticum]
MRLIPFVASLCVLLISCVSTKNTIRNIDDNAPEPKLKGNAFVLSEFSKDPKYGFDPDYPVNVFFRDVKDENINAIRFLNGLSGPNGEKIFFKKIDTCCPFPTKRSEMGAGFIDLYEITWVGQKKPIMLYINSYAKGSVMVPMGFGNKPPAVENDLKKGKG